MSRVWTFLISAILGVSCWSPSGNPQMWDHFSAASTIHEAVLRGELYRAQQAGEWLAVRGGTEGVPPGSELFVAQMRELGARVAESVDISVAANAAAHMLRTCGDCHQAHQAGPQFLGGGTPPVEGTGVGREMRRHAWAAGRLWEGLVGPSTPAWASGAMALLDAPMDPHEMTDRTTELSTVQTMEAHVHDLGRQAAGMGDRDQRTQLYAELISTCAGCHVILRNR